MAEFIGVSTKEGFEPVEIYQQHVISGNYEANDEKRLGDAYIHRKENDVEHEQDEKQI